MEITYAAVLLQSGLPDVSQMMNPEAMLVASVAVGCLGLAVMMLSRPRDPELVPESAPEGENPRSADELEAAPAPPVAKTESFAVNETVMKDSAADAIPAAAMSVEVAQAANRRAADSAAMMYGDSADETTATHPAVGTMEAKLLGAPAYGAAMRGPTHGASALIAKVASLLPAGTAAARGAKNFTARSSRGPAGFQPAARFSRSQQAFLRIPVILTGRDESGSEFREETCTLILLPQGAVIPMRKKVRAGERMMLSVPARQKEVACDVFGALPGPDGKLLVEVEFPEPQKSMWPVSFPAWAGKSPADARASQASPAGTPEPTPALDRSGS